jgi:predicted Mrr-cat superfamily restriction endonuclease
MTQLRSDSPELAYVLRMSHGRDRVPEALSSGEIVIGWARADRLLATDEWKDFRQIIKEGYHPDEKDFRRAGADAGHAWRFLKDMKPGSWVVVPHGNEFFVAEVVGPARYEASKIGDDSAYRRTVRWLNAGGGVPRALARAALQSRM